MTDGPYWARAAVLCRKRSMFSRLRAAFEERGVPVEVVGLGGLLTVPEVADLRATLQVLDDPTADAALLRLLTGPRWRIGPRDLAALGRRARELVRGGAPAPDDPVEAVVLGVDDAAGRLAGRRARRPAAAAAAAVGRGPTPARVAARRAAGAAPPGRPAAARPGRRRRAHPAARRRGVRAARPTRPPRGPTSTPSPTPRRSSPATPPRTARARRCCRRSSPTWSRPRTRSTASTPAP